MTEAGFTTIVCICGVVAIGLFSHCAKSLSHDSDVTIRYKACVEKTQSAKDCEGVK